MGARLPVQVLIKKAFKATVLAKRAVDAAVSELNKESHIMERDMKRRVPHVFGVLKSSVGVVGPKRVEQAVVFEVGSRGKAYAKFVEFGTGPAGRASEEVTPLAQEAAKELGYTYGSGSAAPPLKEIAKWAKRKGIPERLVFPIARAIGRRGIKAKPFVFPAFEARAGGIVGKVATAVARAMRAG